MSERDLFRPQAVRHASDRRFGRVVLVRPLGFQLICLGLVACALAIVVLLFTLSYQRKATVRGTIVPEAGLVRIEAAQRGLITSASVREGQPVQAGEALVVLSTERATSEHAAVARSFEKLLQARKASFEGDRVRSREQVRKRGELLATRTEETRKQLASVANQVVQQQRRVGLAELAFQRYEQLTGQNYVAAAQMQEKQGELLDQQQRLAELERTASQLRRELLALAADAGDAVAEGRRDEEQLHRAIASVERELLENETQRELVVRAAHAGTVVAVAVDAGQSVSPGQLLVTMIPSGTALRAELQVPSNAAGFLQLGMEVLLRYEAYPYQKFGQHRGTVEAVTKAALRPRDAGAAGASEPSAFLVRVKLERQAVTAQGQAYELKPGMALQASLLLERRRLYEWILEPLYSVTGRL